MPFSNRTPSYDSEPNCAEQAPDKNICVSRGATYHASSIRHTAHPAHAEPQKKSRFRFAWRERSRREAKTRERVSSFPRSGGDGGEGRQGSARGEDDGGQVRGEGQGEEGSRLPLLPRRPAVPCWPYPPPTETEDSGQWTCWCHCSCVLCRHPRVFDC